MCLARKACAPPGAPPDLRDYLFGGRAESWDRPAVQTIPCGGGSLALVIDGSNARAVGKGKRGGGSEETQDCVSVGVGTGARTSARTSNRGRSGSGGSSSGCFARTSGDEPGAAHSGGNGLG